jgi:hypothetical protein
MVGSSKCSFNDVFMKLHLFTPEFNKNNIKKKHKLYTFYFGHKKEIEYILVLIINIFLFFILLIPTVFILSRYLSFKQVAILFIVSDIFLDFSLRKTFLLLAFQNYYVIMLVLCLSFFDFGTLEYLLIFCMGHFIICFMCLKAILGVIATSSEDDGENENVVLLLEGKKPLLLLEVKPANKQKLIAAPSKNK